MEQSQEPVIQHAALPKISHLPIIILSSKKGKDKNMDLGFKDVPYVFSLFKG